MTRKKVLVIDDSPLVLEMTRDILREAGYDAFTAGNGIEANQYIFSAENRPDLIIIDIMMPLMAGNRKAQMLKQSEHSKNIPILLISSKPESDLKRLVAESDADGYVCKPFTKHSLINEIRKYL